MKKWISITTMLLFIPLVIALSATEESAEQVVAKNLAARGGLENLQKIKTIRAVGKNVLPTGGEVPVTVMQKAPGQFRSQSSFDGHSTVLASDGKQAWRQSPVGGAHVMDKEQAMMVELQTDFDGVLVDYKEKGYKLQSLGLEELGSAVAYHLKLTHPDLVDLDVYVDADSYLEKEISATRTVNDAPWTVRSFFADYRKIDGVMLPYAIQVRTQDRVAADIRIDTMEVNIDLPESLFKMPKADESH